MATLYFNGAIDNDWYNLGNWWTNATCTQQATSWPVSEDNVIALATIATNSGPEPTVANFTLTGGDTSENLLYLNINISVSGQATFSNFSMLTNGSINGNATFNNFSACYNAAIYGNTVFNDYATIEFAVVYGSAVFNNYSFRYDSVIILGSVTYNDGSSVWTGWNANRQTYTINGFDTPLDSTGSGCWGSDKYSGGYSFGAWGWGYTGWNECDNTWYIEGQSTSLDNIGNGLNYGTYYINGQATSLNGNGSGWWNDTYYINAQQTTLDMNGNGLWNGEEYIMGIITSTLYIRIDGNDNNDGSINSPLLTAQAAFDIAASDVGYYVLDFGAGNFGGVTLTQDWPSRISVRGVGVTQSFLEGINGNGADETYDQDYQQISPAANGFNINITGDNTINLGHISANGGNGRESFAYGSGGSGGSIILTNIISEDVTSNGGSGNILNGGDGGSGGPITITNSTINSIQSNGGYVPYIGNGGAAGSISSVNSVCGHISNSGGDTYDIGGIAGQSGSIYLDNSQINGNISSVGGSAWMGRDGGVIVSVNSNCNNINCSGGSGAVFNGGNGGSIDITNSSAGNLVCSGGYGDEASSVGGNVTLVKSTVGNINANGCVGGFGNNGGNGGNVNLTDSISNIINANGNSGSPILGGKGGVVTLTRSSAETINCVGGFAATIKGLGGDVTLIDSRANNIDCNHGGSYDGTSTVAIDVGSISLVGSTVIPNSMIGSVTTNSLNKGRGINGSNILGLL